MLLHGQTEQAAEGAVFFLPYGIMNNNKQEGMCLE